MKLLTLFFFTMLFPVWAMAQSTISGTVTEKENGKPMPGSHILVDGSLNSVVTDSNGNYKIQNLNHGDYSLTISYMGFETIATKITLTGNQTLDFQMEASAVMEEEVIITASRSTGKSPTTYKDIKSSEYEDINLGQDLPFLIQSSPSVVVTSDAGAGVGYSGIRIRGTDISRINVTINGVPINDPESHGVWFVNMPDLASSLDNMQIQRGVGTSTNGAAAFGASINMQTQKLKGAAYGELNSSYGSFNTWKNNIKFGTGLIDGKWSIDGRASKITSDGYIDRATSDLKSFFISGAYFGEKSILKLTVMSGKEKTYQAWNGIPKSILDTNRTYNSAGKYTDANGNMQFYENETDNYQQDHYQLHYSKQINRQLNLNTALFFTRGFGYYEQYKADRDFNDYDLSYPIIGQDTITETDLIRRKYLDNHFYGFNFTGNYKNFRKTEISFGAAGSYYEGGHYGEVIWLQIAEKGQYDHRWYDNTGTKSDFNVFGKINYSLSDFLNLYADLQYRYIDYQIKGIDDDRMDITQNHVYNFINPKAGLFFTISERQTAYISYAISNREPNRSNFIDNKDQEVPQQETLRDWEAGYSFSTSKFKLESNLFYMNYKNQLVLTGEINDVGDPMMTNVEKSYRAGIEISAAYKLFKNFIWEANATFSQNKINNFTDHVVDFDTWPYEFVTEDIGDTDISFSPSIIANNNFSYEVFKDFKLSLITRYVGKQYIDNTSNNERSLNAYLINDFLINYSIKTKLIKKINLMLKVNNIFDYMYESNAWVYRYYYGGEYYEDNGYFSQAGINFQVGFSLKF